MEKLIYASTFEARCDCGASRTVGAQTYAEAAGRLLSVGWARVDGKVGHVKTGNWTCPGCNLVRKVG